LFASAHATTYFVRSGASGNGTSWAQAWGTVSGISWSSLNAGDTVCVAGGTYSGLLTVAKGGTSSTPIIVKRALTVDPVCGSSTAGWSSAYDSQAVIGGIVLNNSYVVIDGSVWHGFKIIMGSVDSTYYGIGTGGPNSYITLRNIEVSGPCNGTGDSTCISPGTSGDPRGLGTIHWNGSSYDASNNLTVQYVDLHGQCDGFYPVNTTNLLFEHSRIADTLMLPNGGYTCHDNAVIAQQNTNAVFRYNEITNWNVEGMLFNPNGNWPETWDIYGNVFHDPQPTSYNRIIEVQYGSSGPYHFYNNTIVGGTYICSNATNGGSWASGTVFYNNLYYGNNYADCAAGGVTEDYAYSDKTLSEGHGQGRAPNPFLNYSANTVAGYNLSAPTNAGLDLGSPYNVDYNGNTRVKWDRGAFEHAPAPPSGLAAVVH
jgi:hypothetical protein